MKKEEIVINFSDINREGIDKIDLRDYLKREYGKQGILLFQTNNAQEKYLLPAVYSNKYGFIQLLLDSNYIILNELESLKLGTEYIPNHIPKNTYPYEDVQITLIPNDLKYFLNIKDIKTIIKKNIDLYSNLKITVIPFENLEKLISFVGINSFMSNYYMKEISWININNFKSDIVIEESDKNAILEDSFIEFFFKMFISGRTINTYYDKYKFSSIILSTMDFKTIVKRKKSSMSQFIKKEKRSEEIRFSDNCNNSISAKLIQGLDEEVYITTYFFLTDILEVQKIKSNNLLICKFIQSLIDSKITNLINNFLIGRRKMCLIITAVNYDSKVFDEKVSKFHLKRNYRFNTKELDKEVKSRFSEDEIFVTILQK